MSSLDRKLLRDLRHLWGPVAAVVLVMACGVATYVMSLCMLSSLLRSREAYYERYNFAHVFAQLKRAPDPLADAIAGIPGVSQLQTRIVVHATLDVPGMAEPAVGRLVSIPERPGPMLNALYVRSGRTIEPGREGEVLVSEGFADAHGLGPGDTVAAVINGRKRHLRVVGVALTPEYIYQIRPGDLLPDDRHFGVFWMGRAELAAAYDMTGAFNDVALTLAPGAWEPEVIRRLDRLTERYGGLGAFGRADQPSHQFVENEMEELRGMASVVPTIFLAVAVFLVNVVLTRMIATQREQIATLKAFGYTRREIAAHYLKFVLVIVGLGSLVGTLAGAWLGVRVTAMYGRFFHFPVLDFYLDPAVVLEGLGITAAAALAGVSVAVWRAVRLPPAEAMKPEAPAVYRPTFAEQIGLARLLPPSARMILRLIERRPLKTGLTMFGISLATAVVVLGSFSLDSINHVLEVQYFFAQRQDVTVTFVEPRSTEALYGLASLPGVSRVEPTRGVATRMRNGPLSRRVGVIGVPHDSSLYRVLDVNAQPVALPPEGLVLSEKLAELLDVRPGEVIEVEVLEGARPVRRVVVAALVDDFAGTIAYMDLPAVNRLLGEGPLATGAYLKADVRFHEALYRELKNTPGVAGVSIKLDALRTFRETIAENLLTMRLFNVAFAAIIAFGVVYNSARIALAERGRELATLRVLGFTRGEVARLLLGELALLTLVAVPVGLAFGYGLAYFVIETAYDTELFRLPLVVSRWTFGFAAAVTLLAAVASGFVVGRRVSQLDMVAVLKSRE